MGPVEKAVHDDVEQLGDLVGIEPSLAEMAYRLARELDGGAERTCGTCGVTASGEVEVKVLPALSKELRATLAQLLEGRADGDDDDDLGDLDTPD